MANAVGIDLFAMVAPRTYVDTKERNKYAGAETFFREFTGTLIEMCIRDSLYVDDGNNIEKLIDVFQKVKDINHPIVMHIKTAKGHGLAVAEENKEAFHWVMPGILDEKPTQVEPCLLYT